MAQLIDESLLDEKYDPFEEQRQIKKEKQQRKKKKRVLRLQRIFLVVFVVFSIAFIYFLTDASKVKSIRVEHDSYLSEEYILSKANIDYDSRYWLVFSPFVEFVMERDACIKNVNIRHAGHNSIIIDVEEEKAVGYYWDEDQLRLLLANGKTMNLSSTYYGVLKNLPYLKDATTDLDLEALAKELSRLDYKILSNIVEVWKFTATYDDTMVRLIMSDGHQVFTDVEAIVLLQNYNFITENLSKKSCMVLDLVQNAAYTQSCAELNTEEKEALEKKLQENEANLQDNLDDNVEESDYE